MVPSEIIHNLVTCMVGEPSFFELLRPSDNRRCPREAHVGHPDAGNCTWELEDRVYPASGSEWLPLYDPGPARAHEQGREEAGGKRPCHKVRRA